MISTTDVVSAYIPPKAWDSHVHCFNPEAYPFKLDRSYTPQPATLETLISHIRTDCIMVIQASIEDGFESLLSNLLKSQKEYPGRVIRGTIAVEVRHGEECLAHIDKSTFDLLHRAGVRSIRLHGSYGGHGDNLDWAKQQILQVSRLYPMKRYGWSISAQLPLSTWAGLRHFIIDNSELNETIFIADHNGCAEPRHFAGPELDDFLELLRSGKLYVKISALHRRSPQNLKLMEPIVKLFAQTAPGFLLWGSDWPHCDTKQKGLKQSTPLSGVDTDLELELIRSWLSTAQWTDMLVANPDRLFS